MKPEKQVVSLELSKRLKELDYPQEGLWKWAKYSQDNAPEKWELEPCSYGLMMIDYVAPTVAELGEQLPCRYNSYRRAPKDWIAIDNKDLAHFFNASEANARAEMWLYLKKKGRKS